MPRDTHDRPRHARRGSARRDRTRRDRTRHDRTRRDRIRHDRARRDPGAARHQSADSPDAPPWCRAAEGYRRWKHHGRHRSRTPSHRSRLVAAGAFVTIALSALTLGSGIASHRVAETRAASLASTRATSPESLADRGGDRAARDSRASRDGPAAPPRTGQVPSPNTATKASPPPPPPPPKPSPTPPPEPSPQPPSWVVPTRNYDLTSGFGMRWGTMHQGVDLAAPTGTSIVAVRSGTVELAEWYGGYGYAVIVDHGSGVKTLYGHNSDLLVSAGQEVGTGERIALMGSTGDSTGPHLHFEVHLDDEPVDPVPWMADRGVEL